MDRFTSRKLIKPPVDVSSPVVLRQIVLYNLLSCQIATFRQKCVSKRNNDELSHEKAKSTIQYVLYLIITNKHGSTPLPSPGYPSHPPPYDPLHPRGRQSAPRRYPPVSPRPHPGAQPLCKKTCINYMQIN